MRNAPVKIQFELPANSVKDLDELIELTGVTSKKDLFNNALSLLEWTVKESYKGHTIASIDEKNQRLKELVMPILLNAAKAAK